MKLRNLILAAAAIAIASPAFAAVKVYDQTANGGTPGDLVQYSTTLCPPVDPTNGGLQGYNTITDNGTGTVTLDHKTAALVEVDFGTDVITAVFGPGAFVFVNSRATWDTIGTATGSGSTAPSNTVAWGQIAGWKATGATFCIASPQTICTGGTMVPHGITEVAPSPNSPTYDLGTWSFDSTGDFTATSYISGTNNGGTSNRQRILRGAYTGSSIPALPLLGAGALALGLAVAGTRSVMRKK